MLRFVSTLLFALFFSAFFMQGSLLYYLEQRFHDDFGLEEWLRRSPFRVGGEIYEKIANVADKLEQRIKGEDLSKDEGASPHSGSENFKKPAQDRMAENQALQSMGVRDHDASQSVKSQGSKPQAHAAKNNSALNNSMHHSKTRDSTQEPYEQNSIPQNSTSQNSVPQSQTTTSSVPHSSAESQNPVTASATLQSGENSNSQLPASQALEQNLTTQSSAEFDAKISLSDDGKIRLNAGDEVLFMGDSLMQYVGMNAKKFFPKRSLRVIDLSKQSTGLASKKSFDWQKTLDTALRENGGVKLVVVLLGANDVWEYRAGGKTYGIKTPRWREFYASRVREIYDTAHSHGAGVLWLAMPCMQKPDFEEKTQLLNQIYADVSMALGGYFMQTTPLVCEKGVYKTYLQSGSKLVRVRQDDGIHMSKEGCEAVAKEILSRIEVE